MVHLLLGEHSLSEHIRPSRQALYGTTVPYRNGSPLSRVGAGILHVHALCTTFVISIVSCSWQVVFRLAHVLRMRCIGGLRCGTLRKGSYLVCAVARPWNPPVKTALVLMLFTHMLASCSSLGHCLGRMFCFLLFFRPC